MSDHRDRAQATPIQLAEEVVKVVGGADDITARAALEIARIILLHRLDAQAEFDRTFSEGDQKLC